MKVRENKPMKLLKYKHLGCLNDMRLLSFDEPIIIDTLRFKAKPLKWNKKFYNLYKNY